MGTKKNKLKHNHSRKGGSTIGQSVTKENENATGTPAQTPSPNAGTSALNAGSNAAGTSVLNAGTPGSNAARTSVLNAGSNAARTSVLNAGTPGSNAAGTSVLNAGTPGSNAAGTSELNAGTPGSNAALNAGSNTALNAGSNAAGSPVLNAAGSPVLNAGSPSSNTRSENIITEVESNVGSNNGQTSMKEMIENAQKKIEEIEHVGADPAILNLLDIAMQWIKTANKKDDIIGVEKAIQSMEQILKNPKTMNPKTMTMTSTNATSEGSLVKTILKALKSGPYIDPNNRYVITKMGNQFTIGPKIS
jgi:hypothetical protein